MLCKEMLQDGTIDMTELYGRWDALPDPDAPPPKKEPGLRELFGEIRSTVEQEVNIVQAVFPNPALVMQVFLQRVFAQSVRETLH